MSAYMKGLTSFNEHTLRRISDGDNIPGALGKVADVAVLAQENIADLEARVATLERRPVEFADSRPLPEGVRYFDVKVRLFSGTFATLRVPLPMSQRDFDHLRVVLEANLDLQGPTWIESRALPSGSPDTQETK